MGRGGRLNLTDEQFFYVTTTVINFTKVFVRNNYCDILTNNIKHYQHRYKFIVIAYVIMPSYFHWIIQVNTKLGTISDIMRDIKKYSGWDIMDAIEKYGPRLIKSFILAAQKYPNQKRKFWMSRFDDEVIRDEEMFWTKLHYIHNNPVKSGLVMIAVDYRYSSAGNYYFDDHSIIEVDTSLAGIEIK